MLKKVLSWQGLKVFFVVTLLLTIFFVTSANSDPNQRQPRRTAQWTEQKNVDRPGGDFKRIEMKRRQKDKCAQVCKDHPFCRAYTWVKRGVQGPKPVCWLKSYVPKAKSSDCCVSGSLNRTRKFIGTYESATDLPGADYLHSILSKADPALCRQACARDGDCQAYTYVKPGIQGSQAVCYLKESVPSRVPKNDCCISGIKVTALVVVGYMKNTDLPGLDYTNFEVPTGGSDVCVQACRGDSNCQAYTYVKPTNTTPVGRCWLKTGTPSKRSANCCVSGVKRAGSKAMSITKGGFDLPGNDYHWFVPKSSDQRRQSTICRAACGADPKCRAFTYVQPGVQGKNPICYLKDKNAEKWKRHASTSSGSKKSSWIESFRKSSSVYKIDYLGNHPSNRKSGWNENLQGVANDSQYWYFTNVKQIWKFPVSHDLSTKVTKADPGRGILRSFSLGDGRTPAELKGYDHFGDPDENQGKLFVPVEKTKSNWIPRIAVFDAKTLAFIDSYPLKPGDGLKQNRAGWCAIDPISGYLYTSNNEIDKNNPLFVYKVRFDKSRGLVLDYVRRVFLWKNPNTLQRIKPYMQGGDFSTDGSTLYLMNGKAYDFNAKDGGIWVFDVSSGRRIMKSATSGNFKYEFHPGITHYQEPEGITIWDLDRKNAPRVPGGQVHAILLNSNKGRKDGFWLKHYRVHTRD